MDYFSSMYDQVNFVIVHFMLDYVIERLSFMISQVDRIKEYLCEAIT